jgi:hypothetical protein
MALEAADRGRRRGLSGGSGDANGTRYEKEARPLDAPTTVCSRHGIPLEKAEA